MFWTKPWTTFVFEDHCHGHLIYRAGLMGHQGWSLKAFLMCISENTLLAKGTTSRLANSNIVEISLLHLSHRPLWSPQCANKWQIVYSSKWHAMGMSLDSSHAIFCTRPAWLSKILIMKSFSPMMVTVSWCTAWFSESPSRSLRRCWYRCLAMHE